MKPLPIHMCLPGSPIPPCTAAGGRLNACVKVGGFLRLSNRRYQWRLAENLVDITLVRCRSEWRGTGKRRSSVCSCSAGLGGRRLDSYLCQFDNIYIYMIYIYILYIYHIYISYIYISYIYISYIYIYHIYISHIYIYIIHIYIYISYIYIYIVLYLVTMVTVLKTWWTMIFPWRCRIPPKAMLLVPGRGFSGHESRNVGCNKPSKDVMWDLYQQRCVIWFAYTWIDALLMGKNIW